MKQAVTKYKEPNWKRWWCFAFLSGFVAMGVGQVSYTGLVLQSGDIPTLVRFVGWAIFLGPAVLFMLRMREHYDHLGPVFKNMLRRSRFRPAADYAPENGVFVMWEIIGAATMYALVII